MRRATLPFLFILFACVVAPRASLGCTLGLPPVKGFDPTEYVFTGEVTDIVGPFESAEFEGRAWGLKVKVDEAVYLPKTLGGSFEVFPYNLGADCSTMGVSREELEKHYPMGSKVKVIAQEARLLKGKPGEDDVRLEIQPDSLGNVSRNYYEDGRLMTSADSVFDYRDYKRVTPADYVKDFMPFLDAHGLLPEFELRKDLLRLRNAKARDERLSILERLVYYPKCCDLDFAKILKDHLRDSKASRALAKRREAWNERDASADSN
jgi:hypothetical protein